MKNYFKFFPEMIIFAIAACYAEVRKMELDSLVYHY